MKSLKSILTLTMIFPFLLGCALGLDPSLQETEEGQSLISSYSEGNQVDQFLASPHEMTSSSVTATSAINSPRTSSNNPLRVSSQLLYQMRSLKNRGLDTKSSLNEAELREIRETIQMMSNEITRLEGIKNHLSPNDSRMALLDQNIQTLKTYEQSWSGIVASHERSWGDTLESAGAVALASSTISGPLAPFVAAGGAISWGLGRVMNWLSGEE